MILINGRVYSRFPRKSIGRKTLMGCQLNNWWNKNAKYRSIPNSIFFSQQCFLIFHSPTTPRFKHTVPNFINRHTISPRFSCPCLFLMVTAALKGWGSLRPCSHCIPFQPPPHDLPQFFSSSLYLKLPRVSQTIRACHVCFREFLFGLKKWDENRHRSDQKRFSRRKTQKFKFLSSNETSKFDMLEKHSRKS